MNQFQHSSARVASSRCADGSRGILPVAPAATPLDHVQRDSRSLRGARTPWGWRCYGYLPVRATSIRVQDVVLPPTSRGFLPGAFFSIRRGCSRPVANINSRAGQHSVDHIAKPLKAHFTRSLSLPSPALGKPSEGARHAVGRITQGYGNV